MDYEAQRVIEALRSGISSRAVGQYFSSARPEIMSKISRAIDKVSSSADSGGMIISGKYGEGKTHLLNTVYNMAQDNNMVVSIISLSKETPFDKLYLVYKKLMSNTYLPKRMQPGFDHVLQNITPNSKEAGDMVLFAGKHLETDKLFYVLRSYLNVDDADDKYLLKSDIEGDFIGTSYLRQIYKRIFSKPVKYTIPFSKTRHTMDYFTMMSHLFKLLGYNGWVILFDEAELIGRLSKKGRLNAYRNMAPFLMPGKYSHLESTFTMFALGSSFMEDVVESKHDLENLSEIYVDRDTREPIEKVLKLIADAPQLQPLTRNEIIAILEKVKEFHGRAYDWTPDIDMDDFLKSTESRGYLLRTRIRASLEYLDQIYQYGHPGEIKVREPDQPGISEEDILPLDDFIRIDDL
ncbi:MAG: DUF2791 family P-loop domain-containing protein [Eubacteriales bacterium]|nr:DUF2791 family P-loop domain-containing protein [Eubacteriales bacterium]